MVGKERVPLLYRLLHALVPPIVNAVFSPWTEGLDHIPGSGPAILASNHPSALDVVLLPAALDRPVWFLAKHEYFAGWRRHFFERVGVVTPVDRRGGVGAEASLRRGQELLTAGRLLAVYPEGTRSPDGRLHRGKTGAVRLALRTGAPLIPVAMIGTFALLPPGTLVPRVGQVGMRVGRPLDLSRYAGRADDHFLLRTATDALMYEIMLLSGQEYVDAYAADVKAGAVPVASDDAFDILRAS